MSNEATNTSLKNGELECQKVRETYGREIGLARENLSEIPWFAKLSLLSSPNLLRNERNGPGNADATCPGPKISEAFRRR